MVNRDEDSEKGVHSKAELLQREKREGGSYKEGLSTPNLVLPNPLPLSAFLAVFGSPIIGVLIRVSSTLSLDAFSSHFSTQVVMY